MPTTVTILDDGNIQGYLTVRQYAQKNGYSEGAIREQIRHGRLKSVVVGQGRNRLHYIKEDAVPLYKVPRSKKKNVITIKLTKEEFELFTKFANSHKKG